MKPTIHGATNFNATADAEALHSAFKGLGTDDDKVIAILSRRSNAQRCAIAEHYKKNYGKVSAPNDEFMICSREDLKEAIKSEMKGKKGDLAVATVMPLIEFLATEMHDAMAGVGTNEMTLAEILGSNDNAMIRRINAAYLKKYGKTLENDIKKDTSGSIECLLVMMTMANRDESDSVDEEKANADAIALFNAGELFVGTDESVFNKILALKSYKHLRRVFDHYERIAGHSLVKAIEKEFTGDTEKALVTLVRAIDDPQNFFAYRLRDAMKGMGSDDKTIIRIITSRSEYDLGSIKDAFLKKFEKPLVQIIKNETSGDYEKFLLAMLG